MVYHRTDYRYHTGKKNYSMRHTKNKPFYYYFQEDRPKRICRACDGTGQQTTGKDKKSECPACQGDGWVFANSVTTNSNEPEGPRQYPRCGKIHPHYSIEATTQAQNTIGSYDDWIDTGRSDRR